MATMFESETCGRCGGSGKYSFNQMDGDRCYGVAGIHYEPKMFRLYSRDYVILAEFPNNEQGMQDGNAYMLAHDGACLLDAQGPSLILAHRDDKGIPA